MRKTTAAVALVGAYGVGLLVLTAPAWVVYIALDVGVLPASIWLPGIVLVVQVVWTLAVGSYVRKTATELASGA